MTRFRQLEFIQDRTMRHGKRHIDRRNPPSVSMSTSTTVERLWFLPQGATRTSTGCTISVMLSLLSGSTQLPRASTRLHPFHS